MVPRIRCRFVDEVDRFTIQRHELTLETNVPNFGHVLLSVTPIIFEKESDRGGCVPVSTVQGHLKNVSTWNRLRNLQGLRWFEFRGGRKVEVLAVLEQLQGFRGRRGRCSINQKRVNFDLASESASFKDPLAYVA